MENKLPVLTLPPAARVRFERNYIKTAVCELRFPTLLEYETKRPDRLQKKLRKDYPHYKEQAEMDVAPGQAVKGEARYLFLSKKEDWIVTFKSSSMLLETTNYTDFDEFANRLRKLVDWVKPLLDTDFFTRVGLRYINELVVEDPTLDGWIQKDLIKPLTDGVYGDVDRFVQEVRGRTGFGLYTFRHGVVGRRGDFPVYNLDFDFYNPNVSVDDVHELVAQFNDLNFDFLSWAIEDKARNRLGSATEKANQ
jgi:uncharacterized protein (TIGR04255 family)